MAIWLGIFCVGWTLFEIGRLAASPSPVEPRRFAPGMKSPRPEPSDPRTVSASPRKMAAWDERGRRIDVEDLGQS